MRSPRTLTIALGTSALMAVSGVAFAVVQSVDTAPAPQVVIPTSSTRSATPEPVGVVAGHGARQGDGCGAGSGRGHQPRPGRRLGWFGLGWLGWFGWAGSGAAGLGCGLRCW